MSTAFIRLLALSGLGIGIGLVTSLAAIAFINAISWLNVYLLSNSLELSQQLLYFLVPVIGGAIVGLLLYSRSRMSDFVKQQKGNDLNTQYVPPGPQYLIATVQVHRPMPSFFSGLRWLVATIISLASGASVGLLGPIVYLGGLIGQLAFKLRIPVIDLRGTAICCGVAAAISVVFGAPIAGVLFAHEAILRKFSTRLAVPVTLASVCSYVFGQQLIGQKTFVQVSQIDISFGPELLLFVIFGVFCAFISMAYMKALLAGEQLSKAITTPQWSKPIFAGVLLGLLTIWLPDILILNAREIDIDYFYNHYSGAEMAIMVVVKIVLTSLCLGMGYAGGVFGPALIIGVLSGSAWWALLEAIGIPNSGYHAFALGGMMAVTGPVTGAPFATILIVFELTQNYQLTIAAMVGVTFSSLVVARLFGFSFFDIQLKKMGIDLQHGADIALLKSKTAHQYMNRHYITLTADTKVCDALTKMKQQNSTEIPVIGNTKEQAYLGMIKITDLLNTNPKTCITDYINNQAQTLNEDTNIWQAMQLLPRFVGEIIPVVKKSDGKTRLTGTITEGQIIQAYIDVVEKERTIQTSTL